MSNSWQPGRSPVFTLVAQISAPVADGKLVSAGELQEAVSPEHLDGGSVNYWSVRCGLQKHLTIDSSSGGKEPWSRRFPEWGSLLLSTSALLCLLGSSCEKHPAQALNSAIVQGAILCLANLWRLGLDLDHSWNFTSQPVFPWIMGFLLP